MGSLDTILTPATVITLEPLRVGRVDHDSYSFNACSIRPLDADSDNATCRIIVASLGNRETLYLSLHVQTTCQVLDVGDGRLQQPRETPHQVLKLLPPVPSTPAVAPVGHRGDDILRYRGLLIGIP